MVTMKILDIFDDSEYGAAPLRRALINALTHFMTVYAVNSKLDILYDFANWIKVNHNIDLIIPEILVDETLKVRIPDAEAEADILLFILKFS